MSIKRLAKVALACCLLPVGQACATTGVTIVTPASGAQVAPGSSVRVLVNVDPALNPGAVRVFAPMSTKIPSLDLTAAPYEGYLQIPIGLTGPVTFNVAVEPGAPTEESDYVGTDSFVLNVVPTDSPLQLKELYGGNRGIRLEHGAADGDSVTLQVRGVYLAGVERDLTSGALGTQYISSNPAVASVDANGNVAAVGSGYALITIQNGGQTAYTDVAVSGAGAVPPPPVELTSQVAISAGGFRVDSESGLYSQQISIRNTGNAPLFYPLKLVVSGLPTGVTLENYDEITSTVAPVGSRAISVMVGRTGRALAPGATATVALTFSNTAGKPITHGLRFFRAERL